MLRAPFLLATSEKLLAASLVCALSACSDNPFAPGGCTGDACASDAAAADATAPDAGDASAHDSALDSLDAAHDSALDSLDAPTEGQADAADGGLRDAVAIDASDAGLADAAPAGPCDLSKDPQDEPCLLDDAYGVFVSSSGLPGNAGTALSPLPTLAAGLQKAAAIGRPRVFVCQGTYAEPVTIDAAHDGISLYGGFLCVGGWRPGGDPAVVQSPTSPFALRVDSVPHPLSIEDFFFLSPDDTAGTGSLAAVVHASTVSFRRVTLTAGAGAAGADGRAGSSTPNYFSPHAPAGLAGDTSGGGPGGTSTCLLFGQTAGGAGGFESGPDFENQLLATAAFSGSAMPSPISSAPLDSLGAGCAAAGCPAFAGDPGASGAAGTAALASSNPGALSAAGWTPSVGGAGAFGNPGEGGGGGAGTCYNTTGPCFSDTAYFGGNGGGAGGCGGSGGQGGASGSPSVALLSVDATVFLADSRLETNAAGPGGNGGAGQDGQVGGTSVLQVTMGSDRTGFAGGAGGEGAGGGGGAGGNGGFSVAIAFLGAEPSVTNTPVVLGQAGAAGAGGPGGTSTVSGPAGEIGNDGFALGVLAL